jgi:nucleotide-binding universal stress UspA family protein
MTSIERILVPVDFSHGVRHSLDIAVHVADKFQAQLYLLHVFENHFDYPYFLHMEMEESKQHRVVQAEMEEALEDLVRQFLRSSVPMDSVVVENGVPFAEIIRTARELAIDLIVMSAHSRMGILNLLIVSVTEKVVRKAPCPVLTVRNKGTMFEMP